MAAEHDRSFQCCPHHNCVGGFTKLMKLVLQIADKSDPGKINEEVLKEIERSGLDELNQKNSLGHTPIFIAVSHTAPGLGSNNLAVETLLKMGANINDVDNNGMSPLFYASRNSNLSSSQSTVDLLLSKGADVNIKTNSGNTPLALTSTNTDDKTSNETVLSLLKHGGDPNSQNNDGTNILMHIIRYLLISSKLSTLSLLLNNGADPNLQNNKGYSALMILLRKQPEGYAHANDNENDNDLKTRYAALEMLLEYGSDLNLQNKKGNTPLIMACEKLSLNECKIFVKKLLEKGADPMIKNKLGMNAMSCLFSSFKHYDLFATVIDLMEKYRDQRNIVNYIKKESMKRIPNMKRRFDLHPDSLKVKLQAIQFSIVSGQKSEIEVFNDLEPSFKDYFNIQKSDDITKIKE